MPKRNRRSEKGVSLLFSMLALLLLTAIAAGMMFMSSTESSISGNFKAEETAYFAARAGVEEVRDRMLTTHPQTVANRLPTTLPNGGGGVLYVVANGVTMGSITNVTPSNPIADDELCHDYGNPSFGGMTWQPANVRCIDLPTGNSWYTSPAPTSVAPFATSSNPLEYKWVRVSLKQNNSSAYVVDSSQPLGNQVCWNGTSEVVLPNGTGACSSLTPTSNPVYLVTGLAVTPSGARRLVQQEIAQTPSGGFPGGLFATGTGCAALNIAGNAHTGSFNAATQNPPTNPPSNLVNSNGNIGSNGNISVGGTSTGVNGNISTNMAATIGNCPGNGVSKSGNPGMGPLVHLANPVSVPAPPLPNPLPPQTSLTYRNTTLAPGAYGNVTLQGNVTLAGGTPGNPAVYTLNSLSLNGNANVVITGPVVINIAGVGQSTVVSMTGGSFSNNTYVPSNFVINYGGNGNMTIAGGTAAYAVINAPNAAISFHGGSNFYGQAVGLTIDDQGGTNFYWDQSLNTPVPNTNSYYEISLRELSY